MTVFIFTNQKKPRAAFAPLSRSRTCQARLLGSDDFKETIKAVEQGDLVYFDVTAMEERIIRKRLKDITKNAGVSAGILDPRGEIPDPAELFHLGASDYLGKSMLDQPYKTSRLKTILRYSGSSKSELKAKPEKKEVRKGRKSSTSMEVLGDIPPEKLVPNGAWENVVSGETYVFCFLFVELDLTKDWQKKAGAAHLKKVKEAFHNHVARTVDPVNGRIWMWNEYGGVVLFPFLSTAYQAVYTSSRMMLNRLIISCEEFPFQTLISYRLALHLGETQYYQRGETGTIISDTVNFIFHLGQKFAKPGQMYITKSIYQRIHPGFQELFVDETTFENRLVYRMRSPLR